MSAEEGAGASAEMIYQGSNGYVWLKRVTHEGKTGALLYYANPDPRKLHAVDVEGMRELEEGIAALAGAVDELEFCVFHGAYDPVHAGADITQFAGDCDYGAIDVHLNRGTELDIRVKQLWPRLRTVAILCGDRYGGSVEWPLFAEWAVCDQATRLQFSEVNLGIVPGWNGILNVLLKSNAFNAKYMGQTGNPVNAVELNQMGLVQTVVNTPSPPDRRSIAPEDWPAIWQHHAGDCMELLMSTALDLAAAEERPQRNRGYELTSAPELAAEIARRTNPRPYRALREEIEQQAAALGEAPDKDQVKAVSKEINKRLAELGKPLAPAAVKGLWEFVDRWANHTPSQLLANYAAAAHEEAKLCSDLMHSMHRREGVNAILSKSLPERVPVFD
jgi:enoyl-CoA hydratase/carnithine racemase